MMMPVGKTTRKRMNNPLFLCLLHCTVRSWIRLEAQDSSGNSPGDSSERLPCSIDAHRASTRIQKIIKIMVASIYTLIYNIGS
jgi:hypothetical protein